MAQPISSLAQSSHFATCLTQSSLGPWILDLGASNHMSSKPNLFSCLTKPNALPFVTLANGFVIPVRDIGTTIPTAFLSLSSILFLFQFSFNLIFISQLIKKLNGVVIFSFDNVVFQDSGIGRTIGMGNSLKVSTACLLRSPLSYLQLAW